NLFAPNSITYALSQPPLHFAGSAVFDFTGKGFTGGITIERFAAGGRSLKRAEYGTMMRVELARPLPPRGAIDCDVAWHFPIPPYGGGRLRRARTDRDPGGSHGARRPTHPWHQDVAPRRAAGARRRVGRLARLPLGRVELARDPDSDCLPPERRPVGGSEPDGMVHDQALQREAGHVPVAAGDDSGRAGRRHGVSYGDVRAVPRE